LFDVGRQRGQVENMILKTIAIILLVLGIIFNIILSGGYFAGYRRISEGTSAAITSIIGALLGVFLLWVIIS